MKSKHSGMWNGEEVAAQKGTVIIGNPGAPTWWCAGLVGVRRKCVRVDARGEVFYLDDEDGSGSKKVFETPGMWYSGGHRSIPVDDEDSFAPEGLTLEQFREGMRKLDALTAGNPLDGFEPAEPAPSLDRDSEAFAKAKRNDPCPCGSGHKFKHCCKRFVASFREQQRKNIRKAAAAIRGNDVASVADHFEAQLQPLIRQRVQEIMGLAAPWPSVAHRVQRSVFDDHSREWAFDGVAFMRLQAPGPTSDTFTVLNLLDKGPPGG